MLPETKTAHPLPAGSAYPIHPERIPAGNIQQGRYILTFARSEQQLNAVLRLRFEVFNLEMGEGLETSYEMGMDRDPFDAVCHHLMVIDGRDGQVVGTYRLQTNEMAAQNLGYYSNGEFELAKLPDEVLTSCVELGRACIHAAHRNRPVLFLLWKGLASYVAFNQKRFFFGCSSLTSQEPKDGLDMLAYLTAREHVHSHIDVPPQPGLECFEAGTTGGDPLGVTVPTLFKTYLRYGAKICGPPAIDREFKTIDFLMLFDLASLDERRYRMFFE
ncbi:MAG: GNAT family N-acetyltransferase [Acidobacteria bacterium]|nr:GNAT family N-acetyltransferase [Acidobacteriota bacterium]